ncbi:3-oxoacyl-[acyl-carrier-protein] synthase-3 [Asanoa hainanensis]|uniref:3-oxoacyl-[acyl-carrier-protein] synthase-3 n=1 Tax=Asanoa hainanensis TaxID=560556 RepID=A0A239MZN4_9ACTN|nr:iron-containing redox enzyme family protein [Asanoa hainanensis]SNT48166.1 3-oxoacyl-[acyl-carrier-protein] synthase-3 [Asanoa hainanensis]
MPTPSVTRTAYVTACAAYLPGNPLDNNEIAVRLGAAATTGSAAAMRARILAANGIRTRHFALDSAGQPTMLNEELAAEAVGRTIKDRGLTVSDIGLLATGTSQGDLLVPGFASMVHGRVGGGSMELLSAGGVCASGMAALNAAVRAVRLGEHDAAVAAGSELVSRALRQSRYADRPAFDAEFLRWTLSDGAGAVLVEPRPRPDRPSLRVDWVRLVSHAHEHPVCMVAGAAGDGPSTGNTWWDQPTAATADAAGMLRLRQDVRLLPRLFPAGLTEFAALVESGQLDPAGIDHVLCHFSAEHFRGRIFDLLRGAGMMIDESRWFSNLASAGNTGAASIYVALAECWESGRFKPGERVLLIVPESGRFSFAFAQLTCVAPETTDSTLPRPAAASPRSPVASAETALLGELAQVWADFERALHDVPIVARIESGNATLEDYRKLLVHLRQQVIEGGRWISRAASNFSAPWFELRSAAIRHAAEEHRDFLLLEQDFVACGGELERIRSAPKNVGSEALSAYMFQQASLPDPVDLLGAMFVIEGLGSRKATGWAQRLRDDLGLREDQTRFLTYHGAADDEHIAMLHEALRLAAADPTARAAIVRTARVVARLYAFQLAEIDHD